MVILFFFFFILFYFYILFLNFCFKFFILRYPQTDEEVYDTYGDVFVWLITDNSSILLDKSAVGSFFRESTYLIYFQRNKKKKILNLNKNFLFSIL
jgi:hypothetical protein